MIKNSYTIKDFYKTSNILNSCLDTIYLCFCSRCYEIENCILENNYQHHTGRIKKYIQGCNEDNIKKMATDTEHGFFHGLCTAIITTYLLKKNEEEIRNKICVFDAKYEPTHNENLNPHTTINFFSKKFQKNFCYEQLIASALLHDYIKVSYNYQVNHDKDLINFFPNLTPETYVHARTTNYNDPLFLSDAYEMRRYKDWKNWFKPKSNIKYDNFINIFYDIIRPALLHCYENKDDTWIFHGPETPHKNLIKFPIKTMYDYGYFPIEVDKMPFINCSNHEQHAGYSFVRGGMPFQEFKLKNEIYFKEKFPRDHLHANLNTNLSDWTFFIEKKDKLRWNYVKEFIDIILLTKQKMVCKTTLYKFNTIINKIFDWTLLLSNNKIIKL